MYKPHETFPENIVAEANGSYTVTFSPWCERPIVGVPTLGLAQLIFDCAHDAMESYGRNAAESEHYG